jgi:GT2 family glycosyltransferase
MTEPSVSVVICAYSDARFPDLLAALASVRRQTHRPCEILVVSDHNPRLLERLRAEVPDVVAVENAGVRGLAAARNCGVAAARGSAVAFLDDDAVAAEDWLEKLVAPYAAPAVLGTGGAVEPWWLAPRPHWFPAEFHWVVGCSYRGLPGARSAIRNPIGANMSFRREVFERCGGFRDGIGRVGKWPVGCEETEFAIRAGRAGRAGVVVFEPAARVRHRVPAERATVRYFVSRCFAEGLSKALVTRSVGAGDGLASERTYVLRALPRGIVRGFVDLVRGDPGGPLRSIAIAAGLALTCAGYLAGTARR